VIELVAWQLGISRASAEIVAGAGSRRSPARPGAQATTTITFTSAPPPNSIRYTERMPTHSSAATSKQKPVVLASTTGGARSLGVVALVGAERERDRGDGVGQVLRLARADDRRRDPRLLEQPRERDLGARHVAHACYRAPRRR
jgi:hypothetical protein